LPPSRSKRSRTRICVTGLRGIPGVMGGVESHCEEILTRVARLAPDLSIEVLARRPYVNPRIRSHHALKVTPLPSPKGRSSEAIVSTIIGVLHAARRRARVVHIHAIGPALAAPLARLLRMHVVMTHHGADYDRAKWGRLARAMLHLGERLGMQSADAVIAVAPSLAEQLRQRYPRHARKVRYIPNGAPALAEVGDAATVLSQLGVAPRDYILAVGRLVPEKGFDLLIDAIRASGTPRMLLIVGGSDHETPYSRKLRAKAGEGVIFAGVRPRSVLRHLYTNADLFVLPSSHEGLPISALEAGSLGCPLLLSDIQPNRDLGLPEHNYFRSGDRDDLAARLGEEGRSFVIDVPAFTSRFDWDAIAAATLEVYRSVIARRSRVARTATRTG
jgi:glycosyltransferase involved in cell wall biosynthesis